jgi:hypothetical protein
MAFLRKEPSLLPFREGRIDIIGTGVVIVFEFPQENSSKRPSSACERRGLSIHPLPGVDPLPRLSAAGPFRRSL